MSQGSRHQDRVFISSLKERQVVTQLLTEDITVEEFLNSPELRSDNINLIKVLVREVSGRYRGEIPVPSVPLIVFLRYTKAGVATFCEPWTLSQN